MMNKTRKVAAGACFLLAAASIVGCSVRFDFTECSEPADCLRLESAGVYYACEANECVPDPDIECRLDVHCEDGESCEANECVPADPNNGTPDMGGMDSGEPDMGDEPDMPDDPDMPIADRDEDGAPDDSDNCPDDPNADQADQDSDGVGDVCDNCPNAANPNQTASDGDTLGDACDNCPLDDNEDQSNVDNDEEGDVCDDDSRLPCSTNADCDQSVTDLCIEGLCTELLTPECPNVFGDISGNDVVVLGAILPISPPYDLLGPPLEKSLQLAAKEINLAAGFPDGSRIAVVSCDDRGTTQGALDVATHLAERVQVPAIIGPLFSTPFTEVVTRVGVPNEVLMISPAATAPSITNLPDQGLAFRNIASDVFQARALAYRIRETGSNNIVVFYKDDAYGNGLYNELKGSLAALGILNTSYLGVQYEDPATFTPPFDAMQTQAEFTQVITTALQSRPGADLLIFIGTSETANLAIAYQDANPAPPLQTIFTHGGATDMLKLPDTLKAVSEAVAPNIFNPANFMDYTDKFDDEFPGEPPLTISTLSYDAMFVLALAISSIPTGTEVTGPAIAAAIPNIADKSGTPVNATGNFFAGARTELANGGTIDFIGTSGDLDFDANGDVRSDYLGLIPIVGGAQNIPHRNFVLGLNLWVDLCGSNGLTCDTGFTCAPQGVCLPQCDQTNPMCPHPALTCVEDGDFNDVGICAPPS